MFIFIYLDENIQEWGELKNAAILRFALHTVLMRVYEVDINVDEKDM